MQFQREKASAPLFDELFPLLLCHFREVAHYQDIELNPDWGFYERAEELDGLRIYTARNKDGSLTGYACFFIRTNPHYKSSKQASQDVVFIHPEKRGFGADFIAWCDEMLRAEGVQVVYQHVKTKPELDFSPLLERLGYTFIDKIYGRRLD